MAPLPLLIVAAFLSASGIRVADPLLGAIARGFDASLAEVAPVVAGFTFAFGMAQPVLGPLGDRFGKLRLIAACMGLFGAATVGCSFAGGLGGLIALRALAGAFAGGLIPVAIAFIGDNTAYAQRQATLGRFMTGAVMANLLTAPLSGLAADVIGWRPVLAGLGTIALLAAFPLWLGAKRQPPSAARPAPGSVFSRYAAVLRRPSARRILSLAGMEGVFAFSMPPFIGAMLTETYGLGYGQAGLVLGCSALGALLYTRVAGRMVARLGESGMLSIGGVGLVVWLATIAAHPPIAVLAPVNVLGGFSLLVFHGVIQARGSEIAPEARSTGMACFAFVLFMGQAIGAALAGLALPVIGFTGLFATASAGVAVLVVLARSRPLG